MKTSMRKRKPFLVLLCLFIFIIGQAQVSKTINVTNAGTLETLLTTNELKTVTDLTLTGEIDARDFKTMRNMSALSIIDLSSATVNAYNGANGTSEIETTYLENEIPAKAFYLKYFDFNTIILPNSITSLGDYAFYYCLGLKSINLPSSVKKIGNHAFEYCTSLSGSLILPESLKTIGDYAFYYCYGFNGTLSIPTSVNEIGEYAFYLCSNLKGELVLPDSINEIKNGVFSGCEKLIGELIIPGNVKKIGSYAFVNCKGFNSTLSIPSSVNEIGEYAFGNCKGFNGTFIIPSSIKIIGYGTFEGCTGFTGDLTIPDSVISIGTAAFRNCTGFNGTLDIRANIVSIPQSVFAGCTGLKGSLTLPKSVKNINSHAFYNCNGFSGKLIFPDSLTSIGQNAFEGCTGITGSLNFPKNVTSINSGAFLNCTGFNDSLNLPNTLTHIGIAAFSGCTGFKGALKIPSSISIIERSSFNQCSGFDSLYISSSIKRIDAFAFSNCTGFKGSLNIPNSVDIIENKAFFNCSGFDGTLTLPIKMNYIGISAFEDCKGFTGSLTIPDYNYGSYSTYIDNYAFSGCSGFNDKLIIPVSAKNFSAGVFKNCSNFKEINVYNSAPLSISLGSSVFNGMLVNTCVLHVPLESKSLYAIAPQWQDFTNIVDDLFVLTSISTYSVTNIDLTTALCKINFSDLGIPQAFQFGVVWSIQSNPTIDLGTKTEMGTAITTGLYSSQITGLSPNTDYYVRAYATNSAGTSYGEEIKFKTSGPKQLTITNPTIVTNKMVDGNSNAIVTKLGILQGVDAADATNVNVTATATYENGNVGINKTITVVYTLTGSSSEKYIAPENYIIINAKISDYITLNVLTAPTPGCEDSAMDLPYTILTGTPTQYKITFNTEALNAGMHNITYQNLSNSNAAGTLTYVVPDNTKDGTFQGILKMKNELNVESIDYPFEFTINVSADNIITKFDDVILFNNSDKRFIGYQWYINDIEIPGANKQFYCSPIGLIGNYSLKLTTTDGKILYTCPKTLNIFSSKSHVKLFPNPIKENEFFNVQVNGLNEDQLLNSELSVFNMQGTCIYKSSVTGNEIKLILPVNGAYVGHITATGIDYIFKLIVVK